MATAWNCLYLRSEDRESVIQQLQDSLVHLGYTLYNPFGLIPGKAYARSVRLFVAPEADGWIKVIGAPDDAQLPILSQNAPLMYAALVGDEAVLRVYVAGQAAEPESALLPYLRAGVTADQLHQALHTTSNIIAMDKADSGLPFEVLPDDIKAMAVKVNPNQAQKMFTRLTGDLMKKVGNGNGQADAARELISGSETLNWNSSGGTRIQAVMGCLNIPSTWREPDFDSLRDAYPLYERRRRNPNARVYPGDETVMAKVPDALSYTPVYGGAS